MGDIHTPREKEAEIFARAAKALRLARTGQEIDQIRALADNRRVWLTVVDLMRDPKNALPTALRASIISVGMAVQRNMEKKVPDFDFLIAVNENIAGGLKGR